MIITFYIAALTAILLGVAGVICFVRIGVLRSAERAQTAKLVDVSRYEPMQRLLSPRDLELVAHDKALTKTIRTQRVRIFRGYLRCLTKDFGALLGGVRLMMVQSNEDRSDLAALLVRSKWKFALSLCRIELRLALYQAGIGTVDVTGLVQQLTALGMQTQSPAFSAA